MADPLVVGADAEAGPDWVEAHSIDEVERLVRAGRTVVVTPSELARSSARISKRAAGPAGDPAGTANAANATGTADAAASEKAGDDEAAELAAAAVCAWLGARVFRTTRPDQVRLAVAMTESLAGRRPPALARRGLA
ncbi:hypothetical protein Ppa06_27770 [Planomonospora parontospora subsp. parontospora]|uniref:Uncharacterized protein n=2 Tax=Planomonospora parontospora TaxID=58119 RepID=A0AA37BGR1_9ACTN|nr:hypothetical protein [Planomonospora parontospora]GGK68912.1 hypothetical protein GCM10010126_30400 [Planomonospora parontospora]GII08979.1 hypothetical protein Ppa06_27770 [Planomonospora parontospora subsp. parontospora]